VHPICFKVAGLTVHWYGVMMALGFLAGLLNWSRLGRRTGRDFAFCSDLLFWVMVAGIAGARLAYVIANAGDFLKAPLTILYLHQGGLIFYGGFIGGWMAVLVFARVRRLGTLDLFDFAVTSVPLAHAFGRIGCFLNGCCHGIVHTGVLAVRYPAESLPWWVHVDQQRITQLASHSFPVYPIQLYETCFDLLVYALLVWAFRQRARRGSVSVLYLLTYPTGRFLLEFLRGDPRLHVLGLTVAQWLSVGLFLSGLGLLLAIYRRKVTPETPSAAQTDPKEPQPHE